MPKIPGNINWSKLTWDKDREQILTIVDKFYLDDPNQAFKDVYFRVIADMPNIRVTENALRKAIDARQEKIGVNAYLQRVKNKVNVYEKRVLEKRAKDDAFRITVAEVIAKTHTPPVILPKIEYEKISNKDIVRYVIADLHYRGDIDNPHYWKIIATIIADIKAYKYQKVSLVFLGDDVHGEIRPNSPVIKNEGVVKASVKVAKLYVEGIAQIANIVPHLEIFFVDKSNHGQLRLFGGDRDDRPDNDVGGWIAEYIKVYVKDHGQGRVHYHESDDEGKIIDGEFMYLHGHQRFAGRHKIERSINTLEEIRNEMDNNTAIIKRKRIKYVIMGHWHQFYHRQTGFGFLLICPASKKFRDPYDQTNAYNSKPAILKIIGNNAEQVQYIAIGKAD